MLIEFDLKTAKLRKNLCPFYRECSLYGVSVFSYLRWVLIWRGALTQGALIRSLMVLIIALFELLCSVKIRQYVIPSKPLETKLFHLSNDSSLVKHISRHKSLRFLELRKLCSKVVQYKLRNSLVTLLDEKNLFFMCILGNTFGQGALFIS